MFRYAFDGFGYLMGGIFALAIGLTIAGIWVADKEHKEWQAYVVANDCKLIATTKGGFIYSIGDKGALITTAMPDRNTWKCADGVEHTR